MWTNFKNLLGLRAHVENLVSTSGPDTPALTASQVLSLLDQLSGHEYKSWVSEAADDVPLPADPTFKPDFKRDVRVGWDDYYTLDTMKEFAQDHAKEVLTEFLRSKAQQFSMMAVELRRRDRRIAYLDILYAAYAPKSAAYDLEHPADGLNGPDAVRHKVAVTACGCAYCSGIAEAPEAPKDRAKPCQCEPAEEPKQPSTVAGQRMAEFLEQYGKNLEAAGFSSAEALKACNVIFQTKVEVPANPK